MKTLSSFGSGVGAVMGTPRHFTPFVGRVPQAAASATVSPVQANTPPQAGLTAAELALMDRLGALGRGPLDDVALATLVDLGLSSEQITAQVRVRGLAR